MLKEISVTKKREKKLTVFNVAISVRIKTENEVLVARSKMQWLAERIGINKVQAGVLSTVVSEIARHILSQTRNGRVDIMTVHSKIKRGITILASMEGIERNEIENNPHKKKQLLKPIDFSFLAAKNIIDEFKIFPGNNRELLMQITKWV